MKTDCEVISWLFFPPKSLRIILFSDSVISDQGFLVSNTKKSFISLRDNFLSFKKLAILKRNYSDGKIIAVTGSSGKTTVKDLIGNLLDNG